VLRAVSEKYDIKLSDDIEKMMKGISNGFGTGHICAALISSIMAIGLTCPPQEVISARMELLDKFYDEYGTLSCTELKALDDCKNIISQCAGTLDEIISSRRVEEIQENT